MKIIKLLEVATMAAPANNVGVVQDAEKKRGSSPTIPSQ
jgi:hypothetical protein